MAEVGGPKEDRRRRFMVKVMEKMQLVSGCGHSWRKQPQSRRRIGVGTLQASFFFLGFFILWKYWRSLFKDLRFKDFIGLFLSSSIIITIVFITIIMTATVELLASTLIQLLSSVFFFCYFLPLTFSIYLFIFTFTWLKKNPLRSRPLSQGWLGQERQQHVSTNNSQNNDNHKMNIKMSANCFSRCNAGVITSVASVKKNFDNNFGMFKICGTVFFLFIFLLNVIVTVLFLCL